jgi:hypothetical protein
MNAARVLSAVLILTQASLPCVVRRELFQISKDADPLYPFIENEKLGFIDRDGRIVIPPTLQKSAGGEEFHSGLFSYPSGKSFFINAQGGQPVFSTDSYGYVSAFSEGLAAARPRGVRLWGYVDSRGQFVIPPTFESGPRDPIGSFHDGMASITVGHRAGFIARSGKVVIQPQFLQADSFNEGRARVIIDGPCYILSRGPCGYSSEYFGRSGGNPSVSACRYQFIDKSGRVLSQDRYEDARSFSEGLAAVEINSAWGFVGRSGKIAITPRFEDVGSFSSGLAPSKIEDRWGYIDKTGAVVIPPKFHRATDFSEGLARVWTERGTFYINTRGEQAIRELFAAAGPFHRGLANVRVLPSNERKYAWIDKDGRHVFEYKK